MSTDRDNRERTAALLELKHIVPVDAVPCLSDDELESCLDRSRLTTATWLAETTFEAGAVICPETRNGRWYEVVGPGITGTVEPSWPISFMFFGGSGFGLIFDGSLTYRDYGAALPSQYDLQAAAYKAWLRKRSLASAYFATPGFDMSQIFDHCEKMAAEFEPVLA